MKKLLLVLLLLPLPAFGQADSSQLKLQTNGGLAGDTANALVVQVYRGTSAPAGPLSAGMLWLDTNTTPPILKEYTGSVWNIPLTPASVATQADTSSFPGTPTDGQIFFSVSPPSLWVYSSTLAAWATFAMPLVTSAANVRDVYTNAVIATVGAPTVAASGTAGSLSAGNYYYKVTCRNSTGGETTGGTTSAVVAPGSSKSTDLSSIPTCGTGGTTRSIYRTKTNTSSPFYWVYTIGDNSTTTLNDGVADSALKGLAPDINFSAALPTGWTVLNLQTNGGCGGTGGTRGSMVCYMGGVAAILHASIATDGAALRGTRDISAYTAGNFTMQYRVKQVSNDGDTYQTVTNPILFGMRTGTADNAARVTVAAGNAGNPITMPYSSSNHGSLIASERTAAAGTSGSGTTISNPYPQIDAVPFWVRWIKRGATANFFASADAVTWVPYAICTGTNNTNALCSISTSAGSSSMDHVELPVSLAGQAQTAGNGTWLEIDNFTLTVN
jgi:hypothetical protein